MQYATVCCEQCCAFWLAEAFTTTHIQGDTASHLTLHNFLSHTFLFLIRVFYLIPDAVRGRHWAIRYSWNIMPVWNYFCFLQICFCRPIYHCQHVAMLLICAMPLSDMCMMSQHTILHHMHSINGTMLYLTIVYFTIVWCHNIPYCITCIL